jgi:hypothetical protein
MTPATIRRWCDAKVKAARQESIATFGAVEFAALGSGPCRYPACSCDVEYVAAKAEEEIRTEQPKGETNGLV